MLSSILRPIVLLPVWAKSQNCMQHIIFHVLHLRGGRRQFPRRLLIDPGAGHAHGEVAHALNDADPLGDTDGTASIEQIE
jgi:hypothetical protein